MKRLTFTFCLILSISSLFAQKLDGEIDSLGQVLQKQEIIISKLLKENSELKTSIDEIKVEINSKIDTLNGVCKRLESKQEIDKTELNKQISKTDSGVKETRKTIIDRTNWGVIVVVLLLIVIVIVFVLFRKKIKQGSNSVDEIKKVQKTLENAQQKLQEESISVDNKLIEIVEKQISTIKPQMQNSQSNSAIDHSLALKVADEIVRIEANLLHMDSTIKGYKQLSKAVERIKDNFTANDYEIVEMLGKPYVEGMKVIANFVVDETLEEGQQIITKIIKPQVNYKQKMIQAAQIQVSQSE